jgi:hypothetical protein
MFHVPLLLDGLLSGPGSSLRETPIKFRALKGTAFKQSVNARYYAGLYSVLKNSEQQIPHRLKSVRDDGIKELMTARPFKISEFEFFSILFSPWGSFR